MAIETGDVFEVKNKAEVKLILERLESDKKGEITTPKIRSVQEKKRLQKNSEIVVDKKVDSYLLAEEEVAKRRINYVSKGGH